MEVWHTVDLYLNAMGNTQGSEVRDTQKETLMKAGSSSSLKSSGSLKSSYYHRSMVTFTELNPEVYMIPPKSPPKSKWTRGGTARSPVTAEEDLIMAMRRDEADCQAAFQFDQQVEVVSLEYIERNAEKLYEDRGNIEDSAGQEKIYDQVPSWENTLEVTTYL